jgi:hypothetical protein
MTVVDFAGDVSVHNSLVPGGIALIRRRVMSWN